MGALVPVAPSFTRGALPLVEALDCLVGGAVVAALLQVHAAGLWAERPVGVDDPVALPVLLDPADSLPPGALALDGGGWLAEFAQPPGPVQLDCPLVDPAAPGELAGARPVAGEQVGVPLVPGQVLLLGAAGLALAVGGPVGLLTGELGRGVGEGVVVVGLGQLPAAKQPPGTLAQLGHPVAGGLLAGGRVGQSLLGVLALLGRVSQEPGAVGRASRSRAATRSRSARSSRLLICRKASGVAVSTARRLPPSRRAMAASWWSRLRGSGLGTSSSSSSGRGSGLMTSKKVVCLAARVAAT